MDQALNSILTALLLYGYPVVAVVLVLAYCFVPLPLNALIVAAGAFTSEGSMSVPLLVVFVACLAVLGDAAQYGLGYWGGAWFLSWKICERCGLTHERVIKTVAMLDYWGVLAVFLTRWLLTPLGSPINIIAGVQRFSFKQFVAISVLGQVLWSFLYVSLGAYLGSNWVSIMEYTSDAPAFLAAVVSGVGLSWMGWKLAKKNKAKNSQNATL